ncbi:MAG TPA: MFS transporter [Opitutus sp.]|nr:MFS transporter [Opitutus sp.]
MSADHHALSPRRERATLLMLGAVQFTHMVDFMILVPLGEQLMHAFGITPAQFTQLVAAYGFAAAFSGLAGGFVLDRFDRKRALLVLYTGFGLATLACGLAPTHHLLLFCRFAAGAFGGLAGSMVTAMVGDVVPPGRLGRAMSFVMSAFPLASVLGVPVGLVLAGRYDWHAPFLMLAACAAVNLVLGSVALPHLRTAVHGHRPWRQMREIISHPVHLRAFALGSALALAGGIVVPFVAPAFVANVGLSEDRQLPLVYAVGGIATACSMPIVGIWSDRFDRLRLLAIMSAAAAVVILALTRLGPASVVWAAVMMALFMVTMSSRFTPAMAMITNAVEGRYRGGFMSVNSSLQQASIGAANVLAGFFVTREASGHLAGFPLLGYLSAGFFVLTVLLAARLRHAAPHVAAPGRYAAMPSRPAKVAA